MKIFQKIRKINFSISIFVPRSSNTYC